MTLFAIWAERRVIGRMQNRLGPNRAGPFGLLQSIADGIKLGLKEDIVPLGVAQDGVHPRAADRGDTRLHQFRDHPVRAGGLDLRRADAAAVDRPSRGGAARARHELDRRLRHRARGLVVRIALPAARRPALLGSGDQLRDRDGPVLRGRLPLRRIAFHLCRSSPRRRTAGHSTWPASPCTSRPGTPCCCCRRSSSIS